MFKLKVGDNVKVVAGKDKGQEGVIEKIFPAKSTVLVPGVNMYKKHVKGTNTQGQQGGIYDIPRPLNVAKVALICPKCKKPTRVGFKTTAKTKDRVCKKCGKLITETKKTK